MKPVSVVSTFLLSAILLLSLSMNAEAQKQRIITGCDAGKVNRHFQTFPNDALGNANDRALVWDVAFAKGSYKVYITSLYEFTPIIFIKQRNDGKYMLSGINRSIQQKRSTSSNTVYYQKEFSVRHATAVWNNHWRIVAAPTRSYQNTRHKIKLTIRHVGCPSSGSSGPRQCCPPGSTLSTGSAWGLGTQRCVRPNGTTAPFVPCP